MKPSKKGKDKDLFLSCKACGKTLPADNTHKLCTFIAKNYHASERKGADKKGGKKKGGGDEDPSRGIPLSS